MWFKVVYLETTSKGIEIYTNDSLGQCAFSKNSQATLRDIHDTAQKGIACMITLSHASMGLFHTFGLI